MGISEGKHKEPISWSAGNVGDLLSGHRSVGSVDRTGQIGNICRRAHRCQAR